MTAIDTIAKLMDDSRVTLAEMAEYGDFGTKQNVFLKLNSKDLKVGAFVKMLEVLGYQLVVQNGETDDEILIEYD